MSKKILLSLLILSLKLILLKPFIYSLVISMVIVIASVLIGKIVDGTTLYKCLIRIGSIFLMAFSVYMALILKSKNQSVIRIKETLMNTVKKRG